MVLDFYCLERHNICHPKWCFLPHTIIKKNGSLGLNMPFGDVSEKEKKYFVVRNENHRKC